MYNNVLSWSKKVSIEKKGFEGTMSQCRKLQYTKIKWILETPYDIQDEAKNDLFKGYSSNFAANHKKFKMKFRSKKDSQ